MGSETSNRQVSTIGVFGAGRVGTAVARQALRAGFAVSVTTGKPVREIELLVDITTPGARAASAADAASSDLLVLAIPLHRYRSLDPNLFDGKVVIDAMNYWSLVDGVLPDFDDDSSSLVIQRHLQGARLVKSLNHIGYHDLEDDWRAAGATDRRGLAVAGDDSSAKAVVAQFIERIGYDPIDAGPLRAGRTFEPGTEIFNGSHSAAQLELLLHAARIH
jgi:hypothetical protein